MELFFYFLLFVVGCLLIVVLMLPKKNRLKKKEVEDVFKKGRAYRGDFLLLKLVDRSHFVPRRFKASMNLGCEPASIESRFAAIVPMKVSKKAVKRNRIKRLIRENLRKKLPRIKDGFDGIFMALPDSLEKNYWEIGKEVEQVLQKAKLIK